MLDVLKDGWVGCMHYWRRRMPWFTSPECFSGTEQTRQKKEQIGGIWGGGILPDRHRGRRQLLHVEGGRRRGSFYSGEW